METAINLREFINVDLSETSEKTSAKKQKTTAAFEVVYHNDTDFIIHKKTIKSSKYFVFLVSKQLYYIKYVSNVSQGKKIIPFSKNQFYSFFKELDTPLPVNVHWLDNIFKTQQIALLLDKVVNNYEYSTLLRYGIYVPHERWADIKEICVYVQDNPKLAGLTYAIHKQKIEQGFLSRFSVGQFIDLLQFVFELKNKYDFNIAKYFLDIYKESNSVFVYSPFNGITGIKEYIKFLEEKNINIKRFVEYIFCDLYEQGINEIDRDILYLYRDTIELQQKLYNEIKEKYPQYLKTYHDQLALRYNIYKKHNAENIMLNLSKEYENLKYADEQYVIVIPKNTKEIIEEGIRQNHCVASYVDKILEGKTFIVFLRYKDTPTEPLVTVEVKDGSIIQAKGKFNRNITHEEETFLKKWAKEKNLNYKL